MTAEMDSNKETLAEDRPSLPTTPPVVDNCSCEIVRPEEVKGRLVSAGSTSGDDDDDDDEDHSNRSPNAHRRVTFADLNGGQLSEIRMFDCQDCEREAKLYKTPTVAAIQRRLVRYVQLLARRRQQTAARS